MCDLGSLLLGRLGCGVSGRCSHDDVYARRRRGGGGRQKLSGVLRERLIYTAADVSR